MRRRRGRIVSSEVFFPIDAAVEVLEEDDDDNVLVEVVEGRKRGRITRSDVVYDDEYPVATKRTTPACPAVSPLRVADEEQFAFDLARGSRRFDTAAAVLTFWFGERYYDGDNSFAESSSCRSSRAYAESRVALWFEGRSCWFDAAQCAAGDVVEAVASGAINDSTPGWEGPYGVLARVVVLDHFARKTTTTCDGFAADLALRLTWFSEEEECNFFAFESCFGSLERLVVAVALSRSEDPATSAKHALLAARMRAKDLAGVLALPRGYPRDHYDCVRRFGRFPTLNDSLGRASTPEELEWLSHSQQQQQQQHRPPFSPSLYGESSSSSYGSSSTQRVLVYWRGGRGLAEPCRFALALARLPFQEARLESREEWLRLRATNKLPLDKLPVLLLDVTLPTNRQISTAEVLEAVETQPLVRVLAETGAICRYVNRLGRFQDGADLDQLAMYDVFADALYEVRRPLFTAKFRHAAALNIFQTDEWPRFVHRAERLAKTNLVTVKEARANEEEEEKKNTSSDSEEKKEPRLRFLAGGTRPTVVDALLTELVDYVQLGVYDGAAAYLRDRAPTLDAIVRAVRALPQIKAHFRGPHYQLPPTEDYVRMLCGIIGIPLPEYLAPDEPRRLLGPVVPAA
eukprot:CAMPEP_0118909630 /NCGR_PEP_ID=MMETSP1166-20130328/12121_1 /TAXON_ID=1104430 /ORGANISM="Chrysoreinhardia sp, Strain CCMP3193" /LENGTH=629 /DNA_ID=CAMNT_0006849069 /DNA_START=21 /DNA_END=1910 /DNA_ORIENTATION=-